jgi:superfamily II helicase
MMVVFAFNGDEQVTHVALEQRGTELNSVKADAHCCAMTQEVAYQLVNKVMNVPWNGDTPFRFEPDREMAFRLYMYDGDISRYASELLNTVLACIALGCEEIRIS